MSNVIDITDREPNQELIQSLESLLDYARSGQLRSCLFVTGWDDDCFSHNWAKDDRNSWKRMVGEIALAQTDFHMAALNGAESFLDRLLDGEQ